MKFIFTSLFLLITVILFSQSGYIRGTVRDSLRDEAIAYASIRVLSQTDSSFVKGGITDADGGFKINNLPGEYIVEISFLGYHNFSKNIVTSTQKPTCTLDTIYLTEKTFLLNEAIVTPRTPDIVVKGDTIEYNATAYTSEENGVLQDIINKLPGITIDNNGRHCANGKPINKILVDGKEFFDNDLDLALKNLPVNIIEKLQLYKEQSENSKVTGFRDGKEEQVLNLVIKDGLKQSVFGDVKIGYGSDNRYANKIMANYLRNDNQLSVVGNTNNIDDNPSPMTNFNTSGGIEKNKTAGINFNSQNSKKFRTGGNIRHLNNSDLFEYESDTETFINSGNRKALQWSSSTNNRKNTNSSATFSWNPDSSITINFRTNITFNNNQTIRNSRSLSHVNQKDTTTGWTKYNTIGSGHNLNTYLVIGKTFKKTGRNLSINLSNTLSKENSNGSNESHTLFPNGLLNIIDQKLHTSNNSSSWNTTISYVEPINTHNSFLVSYTYRHNNSERSRNAYKQDEKGQYTVIDTAFTRNSENNFIYQNMNLSFQASHKKYECTIGINIDPSISKSIISIGDSIIDNTSQHVINFSPSMRFNYKPKDNTTLDIDYQGSTSQPTISQLSADTVIVNALNRTYGNPNLKPSYSNNLVLYYQQSNYANGNFFMLSLGFTNTLNQIVDYTKIDSVGNTENTYRNINGNMGGNISMIYNTPLRNKKYSLDSNTNIYYRKNIGFTNQEKNTTNNFTINKLISLSYRSAHLDFRIQGNWTYNMTRNSSPQNEDMDVVNYRVNTMATWKLPWSTTLQNEIGYAYNTGYSDDFKNSELLWNLSITKQLFKKKNGSIKLHFHDILNDRNNISRTVSGNYISDTRTNMISRYFLVSFSYRFNSTKIENPNLYD